jgi:MoaA/NifB/PqqE/SkfB family radical SAM enzyme
MERILEIVDDLSEMGCKRVSLGGGEPLLRPDIGEMVDRIRQRGMDCVINSNGYLVHKKIDILRKVDALCLSLDGDEEAHEMFRGKGSFRKTMDAIECAFDNNIPIHTNTVLHRGNLDSIDFVLGVAMRYNMLAEFNLSISCLEGEGGGADHKSGDVEIKRALQRLIRYKKEGRPILFSKRAFEYTMSWPTYSVEAFFDNPPGFEHVDCYAGRYFCIVDTDGDVYPCPHLIGRTEATNAAEAGFKRAFAGLDRHNCRACYQVYHNELNLLFSLDLGIIYNHIRNSLRTSRSLQAPGA